MSVSITIGANHSLVNLSSTTALARALVKWGQQAAATAGMDEYRTDVIASEAFFLTLITPGIDLTSAANLALIRALLSDTACTSTITCLAEVAKVRLARSRRRQLQGSGESSVTFRVQRTRPVQGESAASDAASSVAERLQESLASSLLVGSQVSLPLRVDELSARLALTSSTTVADPDALVQLLDDSAAFHNALLDNFPALAVLGWQLTPATFVSAPVLASPAVPLSPMPPALLPSPCPSPPALQPSAQLPPSLAPPSTSSVGGETGAGGESGLSVARELDGTALVSTP